jgi:ribosomal protein S19E (S16A)
MVRPATYVIERLPQHELAIQRLVRTCETFRSICEDYAVGIEALRRWEGSTEPRRSERIAELRDALAELEQEILEALAQDTRSRSG